MAQREKVGKSARSLLLNPDHKQGVIDTQREMTKSYIPNIQNLVTTSECKDWTEPFYIQVTQRRERLMSNAIRHQFVARQTLPTSDYDQDVWKYDPKTGDLTYLWSIPDREAVKYLVENASTVSSELKELANFCQHFKKGTLEVTYGK